MEIVKVPCGSRPFDNDFVIKDNVIGQVKIRWCISGAAKKGKWRKPWHIVNYGANFARLSEAVKYLKTVKNNWHNDQDEFCDRPVCHAEMTNSFLVNEASLDICPY